MGQTLTNGIFLPNEGERNCYTGLEGNWRAIDGYIGGYNVHVADVVIHVSQEDRNKWDAVTSKADASALTAHTGDTTIHVTAEDKTKWDAVTSKADASALTAHTGDTTIHVTAEDKTKWDAVTGKADASALTAHTGDTTIHVTAADKEAWNGKADASALTAHTGDTTIHVTAEDKAKWDAVTGKADDASVMHLTGDETSTGKKVFGDMATFDGSYLGNEASSNARTGLVLESNRDTHGQSGIYITKFRQNKAQGSMSGNDVVYIALDVLENSVRTNQALRASFTQFVNDIPTRVIFYSDVNGDRFLGTAANKWTHINGINPGALSLPNLSAGVDISGYLTNAGTTTPSEYTPTVDGWLVIAISADSPAFIRVFSSGGIDTTAYAERNEIGSTSGGTYTRYAAVTIPCRQNDKQNIILMPSTTGIVKAMFYPCMGNV